MGASLDLRAGPSASRWSTSENRRADPITEYIWVGSTRAHELTSPFANAEQCENEMLYSDSIRTDGLCFNGGPIRGRLAVPQ